MGEERDRALAGLASTTRAGKPTSTGRGISLYNRAMARLAHRVAKRRASEADVVTPTWANSRFKLPAAVRIRRASAASDRVPGVCSVRGASGVQNDRYAAADARSVLAATVEERRLKAAVATKLSGVLNLKLKKKGHVHRCSASSASDAAVVHVARKSSDGSTGGEPV